jgi:TonB family protein
MQYIVRVVLLVATATGCTAFAQTDSRSKMSEGDVVVISLFNPTYPPLARQAGISGEVELKLGIRRDGCIESAVAVSGHPMLTQAALNSARQSRYECQRCSGEVTLDSLIYSFQLGTETSPDWPCPEENKTHVTQSQNRVTVVADPALVHPYFASLRIHSAKCLYLWACGSGGEERITISTQFGRQNASTCGVAAIASANYSPLATGCTADFLIDKSQAPSTGVLTHRAIIQPVALTDRVVSVTAWYGS